MTLLDDARFTPTPSGRFRERYGPRGRGGLYSRKKLCLVATDAAFLIDLLYGLSLRPDCCYVKYGTVCREGMYLGRCFLATDEAVSLLCQELKGHPRVMASLQDDAWFAEYRRARVPSDSFGIWDDFPEHEARVAAVLEAAFGRSDEASSVAALREARAATVSLVAQIPPDRREREPWPIVGHVVLSPVTIDGSCEPRGLGLAPLAVASPYRGRGIGTRLVEAAVRRATLLGYSYVVVQGHPPGADRLGFLPASQLGLWPRNAVDEAPFLVLELITGALANASGFVDHHPALSLLKTVQPPR